MLTSENAPPGELSHWSKSVPGAVHDECGRSSLKEVLSVLFCMVYVPPDPHQNQGGKLQVKSRKPVWKTILAGVTLTTFASITAVAPAFPAVAESENLTGTASSPDAAASDEAAKRGTRVEIDSARTESSTQWANPDGTFTLETHTAPVRLKRNGQWVPIDTTLIREGHLLHPKTTPTDVTISDGGTAPFAALRDGQRSFGIRWAGELPKPEIDGSTATYRNVIPNGDLVVRALKYGFSHSVVLHKRPTGPLEIRFPLQMESLDLTKSPEGHLRLEDTEGATVATAPAPQMWDSTQDGVQPDPLHQDEIATTIEDTGNDQTLVLKPATSFLADPAVKYPVTIDPTTTMAARADTWVATNITDSQKGSVTLQAGSYSNATNTAHAYILFHDIDTLENKAITSAEMRLFNYQSSPTCPSGTVGIQARQIMKAWYVDSITWANQPDAVDDNAVTSTQSYGCTPAGETAIRPSNWMAWGITDIVQEWADNPELNYGVQLRSNDESVASNWRRWRSSNYIDTPGQEPVLSVDYQDWPEPEYVDGEVETSGVDAAASSFGCYFKPSKPFTLTTTEQRVRGKGTLTSCFGSPTGCWTDVDIERNDGGVWYTVHSGLGKWTSCKVGMTRNVAYRCHYDPNLYKYYRVHVWIKAEKGGHYGNLGHKASSTKGYWCL